MLISPSQHPLHCISSLLSTLIGRSDESPNPRRGAPQHCRHPLPAHAVCEIMESAWAPPTSVRVDHCQGLEAGMLQLFLASRALFLDVGRACYFGSRAVALVPVRDAPTEAAEGAVRRITNLSALQCFACRRA